MQMPNFAICEFPNVYLKNSLQKVGCNIIAAQYNRFHDDCYNVSCNFSIGDNIVVWANVILKYDNYISAILSNWFTIYWL